MSATDPIRNDSDIIDSRDVIERVAYLLDSEDEDDVEELASLLKLAEEGESYIPDWQYGGALIRDDYFITYAQELADDIGATNSDQGWPLGFIDWDAAADALKMDYTELDFDGVTYWGRS